METLSSNIGRYELNGMIGSGAMGALYRGVDPLVGRQVAIKVIRTELLDTGQQKEYRIRFDREVRAAGRCAHPGIVTIYDYGEWHGNPFIVMEYVDGRPLQRLLAGGGLPMEQSIHLVEKLLDALGHVHAQGVVHRDIKPGNLILTPDGHVKITDFGVALIDTSSVTVAGALLGTPQYMAPEQARGERVDHRADLYSVGVVLFRMLTGRSPYDDSGLAAVLQRVATGDPIDVSAVDAISPMLACVVALALQKDVNARFQSAGEFSHALKAVALPALDLPDVPEGTLNEITAGHGAPDLDTRKQAIKRKSLGRVRPLLPSAIGPVVNLLSTKIEKICSKNWDLLVTLGLHCSASQEEPEFRASTAAGWQRGLHSASSPAMPATPDPNARSLALSPQFVKLAQELLTFFVGPISGVVMRQSLCIVSEPQELSDRLALHICAPRERSLFQSRFLKLMTEHGLTTEVATDTSRSPKIPDR